MRVLRKFLGVLVTAVAAFGWKGAVTSADVIIRSVPQQTNWAADGVTEYRMDVVGNTTELDVLSVQFTNAEWTIYIPDQVSFVRAELPDEINNPSENPEDFFYTYLMDPAWNRVDDSVSPNGVPGWQYVLTDNVRLTATNAGPSAVDDKILGSCFLTVPIDAPLGESTFFLSGVEFGDTDGSMYKLSNGNLTINDQPFTIVAPPPLCGDGNIEGSEECDDGYTDACGTCNATCTGPGSGSSCGDEEVCPELESCDDGYTDACGTCNAGCTGPGTGSTCGDGEVCEETEACDDGDPDDGDGCSSTCTIEDGWNCTGEPSVCTPPGIPTVSEWGMVVMTLVLLAGGTLIAVARGRH